mgnify:CR=1 FL=1
MALDWLTDHGVVFTPQPNSAFRLKRMHGCDKHTGAQYVDVLFQNAKKIGVDIKLNTKVVELITNTEANEVLGVKAEIQRQTSLCQSNEKASLLLPAASAVTLI